MIKRVFYFIISCLLLFFSSSINPKMEFDGFYDKNQAIYMIHSNDETESYSFIYRKRTLFFLIHKAILFIRSAFLFLVQLFDIQ